MSKAQQLERRQKHIEQNLLMQPADPESSRQQLGPLKMPLNTTMDKLNQGVFVRPDQLSEWDKSNFEKIFKALDDYSMLA